ncbi:MAG: hypothetical protein R3B68_13980 [Phycisphaerales bacterium]
MESEIVFWMFGAPFALAMASVILVAGVVSVGQNAHGSRAADHFVLTACCARCCPSWPAASW